MDKVQEEGIQTFILIFSAIIWRRVYVTAFIFSHHNGINLSPQIIQQCLKFTLFSEIGLVNQLRPYMEKTFTDGFMMPQLSRQNRYATIAAKLFSKVYDRLFPKDHLRREKDNFIAEYARQIEDEELRQEMAIVTEINDAIDPNIAKVIALSDKNFQEYCTCRVCELVKSWDIHNDILFLGLNPDKIQTLIWKHCSTACI